MSCFFCDSNFHLSQNCEEFVSDVARQEIASKKGCCRCCLAAVDKSHDCVNHRKCYTCLSKGHHTVFCPDRFEAPKLFIPNIDKELLPRFCQMFDLLDRYSFAFLSSDISSAPLLPLKIYERFNNDSYTLFTGFNLTSNVLIKSLVLERIVGAIFDRRISNASSFTVFSIKLRYSLISSDELVQYLLSSSTKILECDNVKFLTKATFAEILKKMPNMERFILRETNIEVEHSWPEDLLKYKNGNSFKELIMTITSVNFDIGKLAKFMATKCTQNARINISAYTESNLQQASTNLKSSLLNHFDVTHSLSSRDFPLLCITFPKRSAFDLIPYPLMMCTLKNSSTPSPC